MIEENVRAVLAELPAGACLVAAAKSRTPAEVLRALAAGVRIVGENYVQEAERVCAAVGSRAEWHLIGHLQKNKVKKAVSLFDTIQTVDSAEIAREIDKYCGQMGKIMPVFIEVNSGRESQKSGVLPEAVVPLLTDISSLVNIKVVGIMTMGPRGATGEELRPCFRETRRIFDRVRELKLPNVDMRYLSMGMTGSYRIALSEGANMVRLGSRIFGERA